MGGQCRDDIREHFPELAHLLQWQLVSTDGPMHYVANTTYHADSGNLDYARSTAIAPEATFEQLSSSTWLVARLPALLADFAAAMESIQWEA